jgi:hypothetical protein
LAKLPDYDSVRTHSLEELIKGETDQDVVNGILLNAFAYRLAVATRFYKPYPSTEATVDGGHTSHWMDAQLDDLLEEAERLINIGRKHE